MEGGGFHAIIGNPPFLGGQDLTRALGPNVREWLVNVLAGGVRGSADAVAYFFLRTSKLVTPSGILGLMATNSVAQGVTRRVGLSRLVANGLVITRAIQSEPWPAADVQLEYAVVWGTFGLVEDSAEKWVSGIPAVRISTLLEPEGATTGDPIPLAENLGVAFQGCTVLGRGFILTPAQAHEWIDADPRHAEVLFPYLDGDDLNGTVEFSASRWVIDFTGWCEKCAARLEMPFQKLERDVKPVRTSKSRAVRAAPWWLFWRTGPRMRAAIAGLEEVIAIARVSKTVMPVRIPNINVLHEKVVVFASDSFAVQAVLSSAIHQNWAIQYGTTRTADPTYTPSTVFAGFPFPSRGYEMLDSFGKNFDNVRNSVMQTHGVGLTDLYNLINDPDLPDDFDPDVARLRQIHVELDQTVMAAYGWDDVPLDHGFHTYRKMTRWTVSPAARVEILDRLLAENHRRAALQGEGRAAEFGHGTDEFDGEELDSEGGLE